MYASDLSDEEEAGLGIIVGFIFLLKAKRKSDAEERELNKYNKEN